MTTVENNKNSNEPRKVLAIDDNPIDLALLKVHLQKMGLDVLLTHDAKTGIEMAVSEQPDLILLDVVMPGMDGFETCKKLKGNVHTSSIPIIFISANEEPCDKIAGLNIGAIDYITKPFDPGELKARISIILQMIGLQEKLLQLSNTDELTGLANRRYFFPVINREIVQAKLKCDPLTVMILDIDHFKSINDTYGHIGGDEVLKQLAKILRENVYPLDVVVRFGGEEFIILMPQTPHDKAFLAAEKLRKIIDKWQWEVSGEKISIAVSIGLAEFDSNNMVDSKGLIASADTALYAAKKQGRNRVVCWDEVKSMGDNDVEPVDRDYHELQTKISTLARQLRSYAIGTISAFLEVINVVTNDDYMAEHSKNVCVYAKAIAEQMHLSDELKERIATAALLQDLGKISIPNNILKKTSSLNNHEQQVIRKHPVVSTDILTPIRIFNMEMQFIRSHHERFDGTGYPDKLAGREIPIGARILAVADTFDAITSCHSYRSAKSCEFALKEIVACSSTQFDPDVVEAFQKAWEDHKDEWPLSAEGRMVSAAENTEAKPSAMYN